jgi:NH3-dependent NAD+ synthetase
MRWLTTVATKVVSGLHKSLSEMSQPDMVHGDSGGQRIVAAGDPSRQTPRGDLL